MKKSGFLEGTFIATAAIVITKILGMLYVIPFYAIVGVKGSALYAYAYNIYVIFLDISSAGIPSAMSKITKEYQTLGKDHAKIRAYKLARKTIFYISLIAFIILFVFAKGIASMILGELKGGNTIEDVTFVIRCVSFAILVIPFLSVTKGYLQGHNVIGVSSVSQVIEQIVRIAIMLIGSYLGIKVFGLSLKDSVGIAVLGALFGGLAAIAYIFIKIKRNREELQVDIEKNKDRIQDKTIIRKIWAYAIPFIVISIALSVYSFIDMVFISRTMTFLGYDATQTEFVTTAVTTWAGKIGMIVNSVAMGLTVSLIPNIVEAYTLEKWNLVETRFNKAMQIIIVVCTPMILGIAFLSTPIWSVFYGVEQIYLGSMVLKVYILLSIFFNLHMITTSTLQSLNKFKLVFFTTILGYIINALLDVPLMILCHNLGFAPFIGACLASVIGYSTSITITLVKLNKEYKLSYMKTLKVTLKTIIPSAIMVAVISLLSIFVKYEVESKLSCILYIGGISIIGAVVYLVIAHKLGIFNEVFGKNYLNRIKKRLHIKNRHKEV